MLRPVFTPVGFLLLVLVLLLAVVPPARAQAEDEAPLAQIQAAFAAGDAQALLQHGAMRVEVALFGAGKLYSRAQAQVVMQDFFVQHPPTRFAFREHTRTDHGFFARGEYGSARVDPPLLVYVRLRVQEDRWELREILIESR